MGCELCAWACPADAIYVEGGDNTEEARFSPGERYGAVYQINYLRCIFCGLCIEACPTRSLTMSNDFELADDNRQDLIYTKEQLMAPLLPGMEQPPHPMRLGDDEKDYYLRVPGSLARPSRSRGSGHDADPRRWRDRRLLGARPDRAGRRARHGAEPQRRPLGALAGQHDAGVRRLLRRPGGAVPGRGADHRLHRRDHDPVPVRADARRPRLVGLGGRDAARAAGRRDHPGHRLRRAGRRRHRPRHPGPPDRRAGRATPAGRQHPGDRRAALHQVPARLRGHQRAADHGRGGRDGAGPHRAGTRQPAHPEGAVAGPVPHRPPGHAARPGCVRPRQLRRRPGDPARRTGGRGLAWPPASNRRSPTRCRDPRAAGSWAPRTPRSAPSTRLRSTEADR